MMLNLAERQKITKLKTAIFCLASSIEDKKKVENSLQVLERDRSQEMERCFQTRLLILASCVQECEASLIARILVSFFRESKENLQQGTYNLNLLYSSLTKLAPIDLAKICTKLIRGKIISLGNLLGSEDILNIDLFQPLRANAA